MIAYEGTQVVVREDVDVALRWKGRLGVVLRWSGLADWYVVLVDGIELLLTGDEIRIP